MVWSNLIPGGCIGLTSTWMTLFESGKWHEGDMERVVGHIAAIPVVLKHSLRCNRDLRDLQGLLSQEDIASIEHAEDMAMHCVDVVRTYYHQSEALANVDDSDKPYSTANRISFIGPFLNLLVDAIKSARFLHEFQFAKGFAQELNFLLGLWFVLLPLALAEISGWVSVVWIPIIALSILGMYAVAEELQMPFGHDLNDLDLDMLADLFMNSVMDVYTNYKRGRRVLIRNDGPHPIEGPPKPVPPPDTLAPTWGDVFKIGLQSVPWRVMFVVTAWASICTMISRFVAKTWIVNSGACSSGWCTLIAIPGPVQQYVGFAFFLLLGFKLADSHNRYSTGQSVWNEKVNGLSRVIAFNVCKAYPANTFHHDDQWRFAGYLSAFSTGMAGFLNPEGGYISGLSDVLNTDAAARIQRMMSPPFACLDVCNAYSIEADERLMEKARSGPVDAGRVASHWLTTRLLGSLAGSGGLLLEIVNIPQPFGYVMHIRTFAVVWVSILPLEIVESAGWMTVAWSVLISYCVLSILTWAEQLAQPFGDDFADLPLESLRRKSALFVKKAILKLKNGFSSFLETNETANRHYGGSTILHNG